MSLIPHYYDKLLPNSYYNLATMNQNQHSQRLGRGSDDIMRLELIACLFLIIKSNWSGMNMLQMCLLTSWDALQSIGHYLET